MPELELHEPALFRLTHAPDKGLQKAGAGAPSYVKARHGIAVLRRGHAAALGPANDGEEAHTQLLEPCPLLARREIHIGLSPALRPIIFLTVEPGRCHPILERQVTTIVNPQAPLFGRIHKE